MNLKQIKYVVTLAEVGTFSGAAEILGISQPSLSQYIKKIENELGVALFERTNGHVRMTDAGKVYLETGRKMLALKEDMMNHIKDVENNMCGTIVFGASPFRSATLMPEVVRNFQKVYPGIKLHIREMATQDLVECAGRGEFDLFLTTLPVDEGKFSYEEILEEELGIAVKKGSELDCYLSKHCRDGNVIDVSLLQGEMFVMLPEHLSMQKELNDLCAKNSIDLEKAVLVQSLSTQLEMVSAGVGCALVPMGVKKSLWMQRDICFYSFLQEFPKRVLVIAHQQGKYLSKPMKELVKLLQKV